MASGKRTKLRRVLSALLLLVVCGYGALLFAVDRAMYRTPEQFGRFMSKMPIVVFLVTPFETMWTRARAGNVSVGDIAPDFTLSSQDKSTRVDLAAVRKGKPVVLVFGSYT